MTVIYGTSAGFIAYHLARGRTIADDAAVNNAALLIASEYIDQKYRGSFPGYKTGGRDQEREWPRGWAFDREGYSLPVDAVPREVENATYEAAYQQWSAPGSLFVNATLGQTLRSVSVEGAVSLTYSGASNIFDMQLSMPSVDAAIAPVLTGGGAGSSLSGAAVRV